MQQNMSTSPTPRRGKIKCLVWDLDNTLWNGILSEGDQVAVAPEVVEVIKALDQRGVLQSIASKNDAHFALERLRQWGLDAFFLYPQIGWGAKSAAIATIAERLNIGIDAIAFIDDQPFERDEVASAHPDVLCLDVGEIGNLLAMPELTPRFLTDESSRRREMYVLDAARSEEESSFTGPKEDFLAALNMIFTIAPAAETDLHRLEELTARTNQLNTTGYIYSYEELDALRQSDDHLLLTCALDDKYGAYGKIGLVLIEKRPRAWTIKLMLMSCRVMSRGVGTILLTHVMQLARSAEVALRAEMVLNDRNRMMYMTYKFAGFVAMEKTDGVEMLEHNLHLVPAIPGYVELRTL